MKQIDLPQCSLFVLMEVCRLVQAVAMYFWGSFDVLFASKKAISQARSQNKNVVVAANPLSAPVGSSSKGDGVTTI